MEEVKQKYETAKEAYEEELKRKPRPRKAKLISLREQKNNLNAELIIRRFEKKRVKIFHKSNSIYALKTDGNPEEEKSWTYWAVYKGDDNKFYETRMAFQWLEDNFKPMYLEALKEQKVFGGYLIYNDSELKYERKFPIDDYVRDQKDKFNNALWKYEIKEDTLKVWSMRAVVTFDRKKSHTDNPLDNAASIKFSICLQQPIRNATRNSQIRIYTAVNHMNMTEIFSFDMIEKFKKDIKKWWEDDYTVLDKHDKRVCVVFHHSTQERYYDYYDKEFADYLKFYPTKV